MPDLHSLVRILLQKYFYRYTVTSFLLPKPTPRLRCFALERKFEDLYCKNVFPRTTLDTVFLSSKIKSMKKAVFFFIATVVYFGGLAQNTTDSILNRVEDYLLIHQNDSALLMLEQLENLDTEYIKSLHEIASGNDIDNRTFYQFLMYLQEHRTDISYQIINDFIDGKLKEPSESQKIDYEYVKVRWGQISELRNTNQLESATQKNNELVEYINQFDSGERDVKRAKILADDHQTVLYQIQIEDEKGFELTIKNEQLARQLNDSDLIILSLYQRSEFLLRKGNLDQYIEVSEESYRLDELMQTQSTLRDATISHLIDAYIYKGGNENRIKELLKKLDESNYYKNEVVSYYGKFLRYADPETTDIQFIFDYFEANSVDQVAFKAIELTEGGEDQIAFFNVVREFAGALLNYGYSKEADSFYNRAMQINQEVYSQKLAKTLAALETDIVRKEKEIEVKLEKEKSNLYLIIGILAILFLMVALFAFVKKQKQSKVLAEKNKLIEKALHEKQLLLKEVHHRVKNNFQIISSLLELQSKGIEDEKAKELAAEGKNRVKSMALIHQKLYQNDDLLIYFDDYINKLVKEIESMYGSKGKTKVYLSIPKIAFDIDTAIPLGLIVNELVTNAFKYGAKEESIINIKINEQNEGTFCLEVKDNGTGMPEDFNFSKAKSMGLRLVKNLSRQLHGSVNYRNAQGAVFQVLFKNAIARARTE